MVMQLNLVLYWEFSVIAVMTCMTKRHGKTMTCLTRAYLPLWRILKIFFLQSAYQHLCILLFSTVPNSITSKAPPQIITAPPRCFTVVAMHVETTHSPFLHPTKTWRVELKISNLDWSDQSAFPLVQCLFLEFFGSNKYLLLVAFPQ